MRVAIIGNFDGVHGGHQALVRQARERAGAAPGASVVAVTFDPHPAAVLRPDRAPARLGSVERRTELLHETGVDEVVVLAFTPELASQSPAEFARLLRSSPDIAADVVMVGENFRFGAGAAGDTRTLRELGRDLGFDVDTVALVTEDVPGVGALAFSSTQVRERIAEGDMEATAALLGRPYRLEGSVVRGDQRGRELGYPTANVEIERGVAVPPDGVYAGWLIVEGNPLASAVSIGTNPQFAGTERRVEAYVIGRDDLDLYGARVSVDLVTRLRGQLVFDSVAGLVEQMGRDVSAAEAALTG